MEYHVIRDTKQCTGQIMCCAFSPRMKSLEDWHIYQTKLVRKMHERTNVTAFFNHWLQTGTNRNLKNASSPFVHHAGYDTPVHRTYWLISCYMRSWQQIYRINAWTCFQQFLLGNVNTLNKTMYSKLLVIQHEWGREDWGALVTLIY